MPKKFKPDDYPPGWYKREQEALPPDRRYRPTEHNDVKKAVKLAGDVTDLVCIDFGSGDGRIVKAFQDAGAIARGVEIDAELAGKSSAFHGINVEVGDMFSYDVSQADVVSFAFTDPTRASLVAKLEAEMKTGALIIDTGGSKPVSWRVP